MKKYCAILCIFLMSIGLNACKDSGSPESITELFIISYKNMDFVTLKNISTKNTKELLKIFEYYAQDSTLVEEWKNKYDDVKIKILNKSIVNDTTVYVKFETHPDIFPVNEIKLIQITEKLDKKSWKVDLSTVEIMERNKESAMDSISLESHNGQIHPDADSIAVQE